MTKGKEKTNSILEDLKIGEVPPGLSQPSLDDVAGHAVPQLPDLEDVRLLHAPHEPAQHIDASVNCKVY